jgi:hypothetical protein
MDGRQREQLAGALGAVFNADTLERWVRYKLDVRLYDVVGEGQPFNAIVFDLVEWADREGHLDDLVSQAIDDNPDNPQMKAFAATWRTTAPVPAPPRVDVPAAPAPARTPPPMPPVAPPVVVAPAPPPPAVAEPARPVGPMYAFVTASGLGQAGTIAIGCCVVLEDPERVRKRVRALVDDVLHDPVLRTKPAITALKRRALDYATDDPEVRAQFIELLAVLSFEAYAYYAPAAAGATTLATAFDRLLGDRLTSHRSRRFALALDRGLQDRQTAFAELIATMVTRLNRDDPRGVAGADVSQAAADEPVISIANYVTAILRRKLEGGTELELRAFERLHPQKIRLIHEIGSSKFFRHGRPLR